MIQPSASLKHGLVYAVLAVLALLSVATRFLPLPGHTGAVVIFAIAFLMAGLVAIQYMGLKWEGTLVYAVVAIPFILFFILVVTLIPDIAHYPFDVRF